jgi:hypothetical protein
METRRIVVPSRKRARNIPRILSLLPNATITVAESEAADYREVVPEKQLLLHPELHGLAAIRNWLASTLQEDCLVEIDDDLRGVIPQIGKAKRITDPQVIAEIIENGHRIAEDLGIGVFCWSRTANNFLSDPIFLPIRFVQPVSCSFGMRGAARNRIWDETIPGRADLDFTMKTMLDDRVLLADMRFYFDHGRIFSGKGGAVGIVSREGFEAGTRILYDRWGKYIGRKRPGFMRGQGNVAPMSIRVQRHNPTAKEVD